MAFRYNGRTPKKITYNSKNVKKLVYNGVTVWTASNPFYWWRLVDPGNGGGYYMEYADGYPRDWDGSTWKPDCDDCGIDMSDLYVTTWNNSCGHDHLTISVSANAKGNTKAKIYVSQSHNCALDANGTNLFYVSPNNDNGEFHGGTHEVDIVNDTLTLTLTTTYGDGYIYIDYIYFY